LASTLHSAVPDYVTQTPLTLLVCPSFVVAVELALAIPVADTLQLIFVNAAHNPFVVVVQALTPIASITLVEFLHLVRSVITSHSASFADFHPCILVPHASVTPVEAFLQFVDLVTAAQIALFALVHELVPAACRKPTEASLHLVPGAVVHAASVFDAQPVLVFANGIDS